MKKPIDATAGRVGAMLRQARRVCFLSQDDAATLLNIMPNELAEYERGIIKIPADILERIFIMSYKMMHIRVLETKYRRQRDALRKIQKTVADA